jgi:hypothetical protein
MTECRGLYVLLIEDDYAVLSSGTNARDAVDRHYGEMDMYCSPPDDLNTEKSHVTVFSIPVELEDRLGADLEKMDSDQMAHAILDYARERPPITMTQVTMFYKSGVLKVL